MTSRILLGETSRQWKVGIFAYWLLDNHYRILLQNPEAGLDEILRKLREEENERGGWRCIESSIRGHKHSQIGGALSLEKTSSATSACLRMKRRIEKEKSLARRALDIHQLLLKSQKPSWSRKSITVESKLTPLVFN